MEMKMFSEKLVSAITEVVAAILKVRKNKEEVRVVVETILRGFFMIAGLDMDATMVFGRNIEEVQIPVVFGCLVAPKSLRLDVVSRNFRDILNREAYEVQEVSYTEFEDACDALLSWMKAKHEYVMLDTLRKDLDVVTGLKRMVSDGMVHDDGGEDKFLPLCVKGDAALYGIRNVWFNEDLEFYFTEIWRAILRRTER